MQYLRIGHHTNEDRCTGVSVFLFDKPAVGAYLLCGSSPASHEINALDPEVRVTHFDGLMFAGGSAYGLNAVSGVMQWLREQGRGWPVPYDPIPIVPSASIYDFSKKGALPPTAEDAYQACLVAKEKNPLSGRIGAGRGATVGKIVPNALRMTGGVGHAEIKLENGVIVAAYAVVNSVGDIRDTTGKIIAGAKFSDGKFADCQRFLLSGHAEEKLFQGNTTLVAVFTNAKFSKIELKRIAKMAVAGMARAIAPVFTSYDGDLIFCVSLGELNASELTVGVLAAEATQHAIMHAVKNSTVEN